MSIPTQGEMKIVIEMPGETGERINTPDPASPAPVNQPQENPVDGDKNSQAKLALAISSAKSLAMQGLNAGISNIGISTGNYYQQQRLQRSISGLQSVVGLAMALQNPITGVAAVAGLAISAGAETQRQTKEREIANFQAAQYAKRLGYTRDRR